MTKRPWKACAVVLLLGYSIHAVGDSLDSKPPSTYEETRMPTCPHFITRKKVILRKTIKDSSKLSELTPATAVTAIETKCIFSPTVILLEQDVFEFKKGETVYVLHNENEGTYKVWHKGRVFDQENAYCFIDAQPRGCGPIKRKVLKRGNIDMGNECWYKFRAGDKEGWANASEVEFDPKKWD